MIGTDESHERFRTLWPRIERGANHLASKLPRRFRDDACAEVMLGAWRACLVFDPRRGTGPWTLCYHYMRGAYLDYCRAISTTRRGGGVRVLAAAKLASDCPIEVLRHGRRRYVPFEQTEDDGPAPDAEIAATDSLGRLLRRAGFDRESRAVLRGYYRDGLTMKQIGLGLGLSESRVSQLHSAAIEHARKLHEAGLLLTN